MKKLFYIEVLTGQAPNQKWEKVRPTNGEPYQYPDRMKASDMVRMCYSECLDKVRIVEE